MHSESLQSNYLESSPIVSRQVESPIVSHHAQAPILDERFTTPVKLRSQENEYKDLQSTAVKDSSIR